jgi:outer membrane protein assembly factor BamB
MTALLLALVLQDWPQFRGPEGQGHATATKLPLKWSESEGVAWKTPIDGLGWSSPVVGGGKIWLTTATQGGLSLRLVALDEKSGKLLHDVELFKLTQPGRIHQKNSHASPTPVLDGTRVYAHFGAGGTAAVSLEGKVVWKQALKYEPVHGSGPSPVLVGENLVLVADGGDAQAVIALDRKTGAQRWRAARPPVPQAKKFSFCTPLAVDVAGKTQLLCPAAGELTAHDPATGRLLWLVRYEDGYSVVPRPVVGHGMVYFGTGYDRPTVMAVKLGGAGDVTASHVAWKLDKAAPLNPSPLLVGDELYLVSDQGVATCLDAKSGKVHWTERIGGSFSASPLHGAGRIYFLDENGACTVIKPGKTYESLAKNQVGGRSLASLVPLEGALLLRTDKQLFRIEGE